ncbi:hypothetical protein HRbin29_02355 [bacterium HR29]|jgi:energy-coupling factor transport system permease protein|nr:hypothetical protein HRbin29_02355 [bacterium HR29]
MATTAWLAWAAMVMAVALTVTNPFYLAVVVLGVILVAVLAPKDAAGAAGLRVMAFFGASVLLFAALVAVINGSYGEHELFRVPSLRVPEWLGGLRLGGPVTAEQLVNAAIRGLAILAIVLAFATVNAAVTPQRLLRAAPAALFHAALVATIGLTLLPATIEDSRRIREAQALRGGGTGLRQLPGLAVPVVLGGLERSLRLAEAMEARGFAPPPSPPAWARAAALLSAPLGLAGGLCWLYLGDARWVGALLGGVAVVLFGAWLTAASRRRVGNRLRPERLTGSERAAVAFAAAIAALAIFGRAPGWLELGYSPFAGLAWPPFAPLEAGFVLSVVWPSLFLAGRWKPAPRGLPAAGVAEVGRP